ncbi:MAG: RNA-binding S4 domain-containing protein [Rhodospirillales bacterium]
MTAHSPSRKPSAGTVRLDKWLWYARFFKSRSLATKLSAEGRIRVNGTRTVKAHHALKVGDVLTFSKGPHIRVVEVRALGVRRGPAAEAKTLYADLEPPWPKNRDEGAGRAAAAIRSPGAGRPTKAERRATDRLKGKA